MFFFKNIIIIRLCTLGFRQSLAVFTSSRLRTSHAPCFVFILAIVDVPV